MDNANTDNGSKNSKTGRAFPTMAPLRLRPRHVSSSFSFAVSTASTLLRRLLPLSIISHLAVLYVFASTSRLSARPTSVSRSIYASRCAVHTFSSPSPYLTSSLLNTAYMRLMYWSRQGSRVFKGPLVAHLEVRQSKSFPSFSFTFYSLTLFSLGIWLSPLIPIHHRRDSQPL
ncbi:hypothetical protein H4582DRAFT_745155 [Lactarius indigo]|nr:hypothetical protein H4582DRAFT_745155 [Lactarius indigo]